MTTYMFPTYDLDLSELEDVDDPKRVVDIASKLINADNDFKILPARQWVENFLYYAGMKDFMTRFSTGTVTNNSLAPVFMNRNQVKRRHIPKFFKACQIQAQNITRQRASVKVWPVSDDEEAERKAKLSNITIDYFWDADSEDDKYYEAILWCLLSPAVARKDTLDYRFRRTRLWPKEIDVPRSVPMVGPDGNYMVDQFGRPMLMQQMEKQQQMDDDGNPMFEQLPWYSSENISAFRLIFNPTTTWTDDLDFIGDVGVKRLMWLKQNYDRHEEGYHPENVEKLTAGSWNYTAIMGMETALKQLAFGATRTYRNFNYGAIPMKDGCVTFNLFINPSPKYPKGREIVVANQLLMYDGAARCYRELPTENWHPYAAMTYERVPGRLWGTTYGEKLSDMARSYDQARMELEQMRKTFSKPKMAIPIGAQIDRDTITGNEEIYRYNPYGADGGKPQYMQAPNPPATLMDDLKIQNEEWVEISGITQIMQGIRPQGVTTYRGLEVLREEANNAANNFIRMYEAFIAKSQFNKLELIRASMTKPDKSLTQALRIFKKMNHYVTDVDIIDFCGEDLAGFVKVEPFSTIGKSRLALQAKYESMAQLGVLGDIVNDPDLNGEYKRKMDVIGFDAPKNRQVVYARYENQMMLEAEKRQMIINPPVSDYHDHPLHMREVENLLLDPTLQGKQFIIQSLTAHRAQHMQVMAQMQAQMMQSQLQNQMMQAGVAGGQPQPGGGQPQPGQQPTPAKMDEGTLFGPETGFVSGGQPGVI